MTTTFRPRSAEDMLAVVPVVLGFEPEDSIVMLTFGGRRSFHARVDLPPPEDVDDCVTSLLGPARHHGVRQVLFVLYSPDDRQVRRAARALRRRFRQAGLQVLDVLQVYDGRWFCPLGRAGVPALGVPYDVSNHPFRVRAVVDGRIIAASRQELVERLRPDPDGVRSVTAALSAAPLTDGPGLRALLEPHLAAGSAPTDAEAAVILLSITDATVRDDAWFGMTRRQAEDNVRLWTELVRRAPAGLVAGAAAVLGFAAWLHGDGALAWCALDRCFAEEPEHSLGRLVAQALDGAVAPDDWEAGMAEGLAG